MDFIIEDSSEKGVFVSREDYNHFFRYLDKIHINEEAFIFRIRDNVKIGTIEMDLESRLLAWISLGNSITFTRY